MISVASVLFAVVIALGTRSMQLGSYDRLIDNLVSFYTGYIQIQHPDYHDSHSLDDSFILSDSLLAAIESSPGITAAAPRLESFGLLSSGKVTDGAMIVGFDVMREEKLTHLGKWFVEGGYPAADRPGLVLGKSLATHLQLVVGDTAVILSQGYHGVSAAGKYPVAGIISFPSPDLDARLAYLPLDEAQRLFDAGGRTTSLALMVKNQKRLPVIASSLKRTLGGDYIVLDWKEMLPEVVQYIEMDNASGIIMLAIIYLVIGFGILGTILMMTMERQREFGVLIAVGMKKNWIRLMVVIESILLSFIGAVGGVAVGFPILLYLFFNPIKMTGPWADYMIEYGFEPILPFSLAPGVFINQTISVLIIALMAAIYPVWRIGKINPTTAQRG